MRSTELATRNSEKLPTPKALRQALSADEQARRLSIIITAKDIDSNWYDFAKYRFVADGPGIPGLKKLTSYHEVRGLPIMLWATSWPQSESSPHGSRLYTHEWLVCFTGDEVIDTEVGVAYGAIVAGIGKLAAAEFESFELGVLKDDICDLISLDHELLDENNPIEHVEGK